jgi:acetyl-CoA synthetase
MMGESIIKSHHDRILLPNLADYEGTCRQFRWEEAIDELDGLPNRGGLNMAYEAVDRHVIGPRRDQLALRWLGRRGESRDFTYTQLRGLTNHFANVLEKLGVKKGERVFSLLGRVPELYVTALGTLKHRAVFCPLFSAFGPEPILARAAIGTPKVLVTTESLYRRKIAPIREQLTSVEWILLVGENHQPTDVPGTLDYHTLIYEVSGQYQIGPTHPEDPAFLHFTSGTTGRPKAAVHVHEAVVAQHVTGRYALDLQDGDTYWCTADPGWVTGTAYGIISPLTNGVTMLVDEGEFDVDRWYRTIETERVTVWYTAPTAIRLLMKAGTAVARGYDLSSLRFLASVGEPLNPEAVRWSQEAFGEPFHDNWWQTETGGIMIANLASLDVHPGSMGRPLPGIEASIVERDEEGVVRILDQPNAEGELALRIGWPSMFRGYLGEEERYRQCFAGDLYLTGDLARRDEAGSFWFIGRKDDVIKTAGHLVGPFEVESALLEHPAVAEAAVIGKPDPVTHEVIKAFVTLRSGHAPSETLRREIVGHARQQLGASIAPKELEIVSSLPRTRSGKIMRRLLKARELGLPEGDLSTLEEALPDPDGADEPMEEKKP